MQHKALLLALLGSKPSSSGMRPFLNSGPILLLLWPSYNLLESYCLLHYYGLAKPVGPNSKQTAA
jgi:hypothetical protein